MRLEAKNISYRYGEKFPWILNDVSISVDEGERVSLVGPSGYGKSTLLRLMAGYLKPASGEILLDQKPLPTTGICPVQLIYQHPVKAINPRWKMKKVLEESGMFRKEVTERKLGLLMVTHNKALADRVCTRTIDLRTHNK